jgi:hypothetical protein
MRHTYNEIQKEKICQMIYDWLLKYNAFSGEHVMQDDDCQIYASELLSEIADIKDVTEDLNKSDKKFDSIFEYTRTLKDGTDKWRFAIDTATKYAKENKNPNDYIEEIITLTENEFK